MSNHRRVTRVARGVPEDKVRYMRDLRSLHYSIDTHAYNSGTACWRYGTEIVSTYHFALTLTTCSLIGNYTCDEAWWRFRGSSFFLMRKCILWRSDMARRCGRKICSSLDAGVRVSTSSTPRTRCTHLHRLARIRRTPPSKRGCPRQHTIFLRLFLHHRAR